MELSDILEFSFQEKMDYILNAKTSILDEITPGYFVGKGAGGEAWCYYLQDGTRIIEKRIFIRDPEYIDSAVKEVYFGILLQSCDFTPDYLGASYNHGRQLISLYFTFIEGYTAETHIKALKAIPFKKNRIWIRRFIALMWEAGLNMIYVMAYKYGVYHRDIQTCNMMYNNGKFYLIDFGISSIMAVGKISNQLIPQLVTQEIFFKILQKETGDLCYTCVYELHECEKYYDPKCPELISTFITTFGNSGFQYMFDVYQNLIFHSKA